MLSSKNNSQVDSKITSVFIEKPPIIFFENHAGHTSICVIELLDMLLKHGKVFILFGKTGVGKSYIGEYLQQHHGFLHFDADQLITEPMKQCIVLGEQMRQEMIDDYMEIVKGKIRYFYHGDFPEPVVMSQALYRNKNRLDILNEFPNIHMVLVEADEALCYQRIQARNNAVTVTYAKNISALFESPQGFDYAVIDNHSI